MYLGGSLVWGKLSCLLRAGKGLSPGVVAVLAWPRQGVGSYKRSDLGQSLHAEPTPAGSAGVTHKKVSKVRSI